MNTIHLMLAPMLALQAAGQAPVAIENDAPETWTLEYPRLIQPFVADYRRCLTGQMRRVRGKADFEAQHRADVATCEEQFEEAMAAANGALSGRSEYADLGPDDVREIFEHVGRIHIARGADLDNQFTYLQRAMAANQQEYEDERPKGLVLELRDASVVKARTDATAAAAEAAYEEHQREMQMKQQNEGVPGAPN